MKKVILLAVATATLMTNVSCRKEDDPHGYKEKERVDNLLKNNYLNDVEYKLISKIRTADKGKFRTQIIQYDKDECSSKSFIKFYGDGIGDWVEYTNEGGKCEKKIEETFSWEVDNISGVRCSFKNKTIIFNILNSAGEPKIEGDELIFIYPDFIEKGDKDWVDGNYNLISVDNKLRVKRVR